MKSQNAEGDQLARLKERVKQYLTSLPPDAFFTGESPQMLILDLSIMLGRLQQEIEVRRNRRVGE